MGWGQAAVNDETIMRDGTNQSDDELLIRDQSIAVSQENGLLSASDKMTFKDDDLVDEESSQEDEALDTVGGLSNSVRSTLFDDHLLPAKSNSCGSYIEEERKSIIEKIKNDHRVSKFNERLTRASNIFAQRSTLL